MLFPKEHKSKKFTGTYTFKADYLCKDLYAFYCSIRQGIEEISTYYVSELETEEYILRIKPEGIELLASEDEGIYRGVTSLYQLLKRQGKILPCLEIQDKPQFPRRGYMLDISRCRMRKVETIKKLIDYLSGLKYNELQLYMEGDCFRYSAYPQYTADFECLTPENIVELDAYCSQRFIDLVPNQNSLGHLGVWLEKDEFKSLRIGSEAVNTATINPLLEESFDFIHRLYDSTLPHFRSGYANIGLDEAGGLGEFQVAEYCQAYGKDILFMQWLNKLNDLVQDKYGKKVMFWSDMIYKSERLYPMIPKDAVVLEWGYELIQSQLMTEHCIAFKNAGLNYYVCPSCNTPLSFTGRADVTSFNIRTAAEIGAKYGAQGLLLTDWGCGEGHPHFDVWSYVPIALAGQYGWNIGQEQNGELFKADFIRSAEAYADHEIFGCTGVSRQLYRMANYYLLEPERVHLGSMCGLLFRFPLEKTDYYGFFDLTDSGDVFYFDNVTAYMQKNLEAITELPFDLQLKREIIINGKMVILASELCKLRIGCPISDEALDNLLSMIEWIEQEYRELWCSRNFTKGVEDFENQLLLHKKELQKIKGSRHSSCMVVL